MNYDAYMTDPDYGKFRKERCPDDGEYCSDGAGVWCRNCSRWVDFGEADE